VDEKIKHQRGRFKMKKEFDLSEKIYVELNGNKTRRRKITWLKKD